MDSLPLYVGLDYHQASVQVCVLDGRGRVLLNRSGPNDPAAIRGAVEGCGGTVAGVALEACTGTADLAQELHDRLGWPVELAHAGYVQKVKRQPDKSDWSDARLLADLTRVGYLPRVWLAPLYLRQLRQLVGYRQQLVQERRAAKLRITALLREHRVGQAGPGRRWGRAWRGWLEQPQLLPPASAWILGRHLEHLLDLERRVRQAEGELERYTAADATVAWLQTQEGVGPVTAWVLRAQVGQVGRFRSGKQLAHYCGLSPVNASSGPRQADAGLVAGADRLLRSTLIELAHRLGRTQVRWAELKAKLKGRGKAGSLAAAAVANRWVRGLYHPWREWEEQNADRRGQEEGQGGRSGLTAMSSTPGWA